MTRHPVCMTTVHGSHPPPCSKFSKHKPPSHQHVQNHDAVYAGNGLGVIGSILNRPTRPQLGFGAIVPGTVSLEEVHDDDYEWDFKRMDPDAEGSETEFEIEPTAAVRLVKI